MAVPAEAGHAAHRDDVCFLGLVGPVRGRGGGRLLLRSAGGPVRVEADRLQACLPDTAVAQPIGQVGGDVSGTHQEESVAVAGLSDAAARALGRRFGQDALFAWTPDASRVLACDNGAVAASGWAASVRAPT
ncbi:DUF3293 domain-containing protein [Streptomyces werraensis]|uniref:DUF3293 domain-containing protein n=1 Tax=Streptomyces werraensis TaxID=68284 RepID=UPI0034166180